jgi:hypothetical protein
LKCEWVPQNLGLSQDYKDSDSEIGKWLKQALAHFLDPTEVEDCFVEDYMASAPQENETYSISDLQQETHC